MKKYLAIFLQVLLVLIALGVLIFMLWEPHLEGRNVHATVFEIYFNDPFLLYAYTASVSFFTGLYQAFKLLGYVGRNETFSEHSVKALRTIKYCAMTLIGFILVPLAYLWIVRPGDDIAGGVAMSLLIILASGVVAIIAGIFEKLLQKGLNIK